MVCGCFLVVCGRLLVVCGHLMLVCGGLLWLGVVYWWFMVVCGGLWSLPVLVIMSSSLQTIVYINTWLGRAIIIFVI